MCHAQTHMWDFNRPWNVEATRRKARLAPRSWWIDNVKRWPAIVMKHTSFRFDLTIFCKLQSPKTLRHHDSAHCLIYILRKGINIVQCYMWMDTSCQWVQCDMYGSLYRCLFTAWELSSKERTLEKNRMSDPPCQYWPGTVLQCVISNFLRRQRTSQAIFTNVYVSTHHSSCTQQDSTSLQGLSYHACGALHGAAHMCAHMLHPTIMFINLHNQPFLACKAS